jgi:CheY-like chemotaxis protein
VLRVDRILGAYPLQLQPLESSGAPPGAVASSRLPGGELAIVLDFAQLVLRLPSRERRLQRQPGRLALVADDSISTRRALCTLLEGDDWAVVEARDGLEAWEQLERAAPNLLLVDLDLALLDAVQVIRAARSQPNTRVVALLNADDPIRQSQLQALGVDALLPKPIDEPALIDTLRLLVPRPA